MRSSLLAPLAVAAAAVAVALIVISGGENAYVVKLEMHNANGLKDGSPVTIGGVVVGKADVEVDARRDVVVAELRIEDRYAPVGRDASAAILAQNLLGQKSVRITPGDPVTAAPSGFVIPELRITAATDLDQVLNVLDADTRTRLAIFVNEAGAAFTGRRADFNRFLRDIAPAIAQGTDLVQELGRENRKLGELLATTDAFVAEMTHRRGDVVRMVDRFGRAAAVSAGKRGQLRRTIAEAPGAVRSLQGFLAQLESTTEPLGPAARRLSAAAAPLRAALARLEPFSRSAAPALRTAVSVAPQLVELSARATPVLNAAEPTTAALRTFSASDLPPVSDTAKRSIDNTLGVVENWARAIQFSDNLSHIFRGEASFAPDAIVSVVNRLAGLSDTPRPKTRRRPQHRRDPAPTEPRGEQRAPGAAPPVRALVPQLRELIPQAPVPDSGGAPDRQSGLVDLLDFLLK